jgi:hypothetical protein
MIRVLTVSATGPVSMKQGAARQIAQLPVGLALLFLLCSSRGGTRTPDPAINRHRHRARDGSLSEDGDGHEATENALVRRLAATISATGLALEFLALIVLFALAMASVFIAIPGAFVMLWLS